MGVISPASSNVLELSYDVLGIPGALGCGSKHKFNHFEVKTLKDILSVDYEARFLTNKIIKKSK